MADAVCSYITFHHVVFSAPINAADRTFEAPSAAIHWLFGPSAHVDSSGKLVRASERWSGAAFYSNRQDAESVLNNIPAMLPCLSDAIETWHGLICPTAHHGEVNWFNSAGRTSRIVPVPEDPGGTLVVMTSAGYNPLSGADLTADLPRRIAFTAAAERVANGYRTLPGNLASSAFLPHPPGRDGMTFTAWSDTASMLAAAYQTGMHRGEMEQHKVAPQFDRSSFTRARILKSLGTWNGLALA